MNRNINCGSMFLLWAGAAISIAEIYTGGLIAPLGLQQGVLAIIVGHVIGTVLLAMGGYMSFSHRKNAMDVVREYTGIWGARAVAALNVLQLLGWSAVMMIQGGRALSAVLDWPLNTGMLVVAALVVIWVYTFQRRIQMLNNISVVTLLGLCLVLFWQVKGGATVVASGDMNFTTALELSIAMPVSWLPLIGDYTKDSDSAGGTIAAFSGYFLGSLLMYILGLVIVLHTGQDIIAVISGFGVKWAACFIIVLSTVTTTFLDIYSAVVSAKQFIATPREHVLTAVICALSISLAFVFPMEQYETFLLLIGSVFIPVYAVIFMDYFVGWASRADVALNWAGMIVAILGVMGYQALVRMEFGMPTVIIVVAVAGFYWLIRRWWTAKLGHAVRKRC